MDNNQGPTVPVTYQPVPVSEPGGLKLDPVGMSAAVPVDVPPGLEYLTQIDQILIHQRVELLEAITGFETNNQYEIKNSLGQPIYWAEENNDCCTRNFCGSLREFDMIIRDGMDREVIRLIRPCRCDSCCCPCCLQKVFGKELCYDKVSSEYVVWPRWNVLLLVLGTCWMTMAGVGASCVVKLHYENKSEAYCSSCVEHIRNRTPCIAFKFLCDTPLRTTCSDPEWFFGLSWLSSLEVQAPPGTTIGYVTQEWHPFLPKFSIQGPDKETHLKLEGPFCACSCFGDVDFELKGKDGGESIGCIKKQWTGLVREALTDTDNFGIQFPLDLDVKIKAVLLGACFLIDFMFFEMVGEST